MERKKRVGTSVAASVPDDRIQWRKLGGGFLRLPNRIIKPGDVFWASPNEISKAFRDQVVPLNPEDLKRGADKPAEEIVPKVKIVYTKKQRPDTNWFDIFDSKGKRVNEKALREDQVDDYLKALQG